LLLKQTKPNSPLKKSLQKIIQQNFTNYFLANKIVDHVDNSCMVLTRNDQISYSFPVKDASFVRGNAVPHAVPCYPLKGVEVLLCLPHPSLMEQGGNVVSQGIKLKSGKHQNYKENYLSLEKLKKRNQYVIN
ncbi:hypothetical protein, partial [Pantoea sp. Ft+CA_17]|uniref:hypothetical protein n=1 Tax=Pantoea sp. Ft+CA_17 TaxID=2929508 RepID=UPI0021193D97